MPGQYRQFARRRQKWRRGTHECVRHALKPARAASRHLYFMRFPLILLLAAASLAQAQSAGVTLKIPPVKATLDLEGQAVEIAVWGTAWAAPSGVVRLSITADLGGLQDNLTPVLAAQLNRSDRCGDRLTVERAVLAPSEPAGVLTANVHYERFACAKAFGKEVVKRLAGGNAMVEALLTPSIGDDGLALAAAVRKIDADGSLGELLRSGPLGDSLREKIASAIESAVRKSANLQAVLPPEMAGAATIQSARFADGGAGKLWLTLTGEVRLGPEQLRDVVRKLGR